jgi:hypothetical protein
MSGVSIEGGINIKVPRPLPPPPLYNLVTGNVLYTLDMANYIAGANTWIDSSNSRVFTFYGTGGASNVQVPPVTNVGTNQAYFSTKVNEYWASTSSAIFPAAISYTKGVVVRGPGSVASPFGGSYILGSREAADTMSFGNGSNKLSAGNHTSGAASYFTVNQTVGTALPNTWYYVSVSQDTSTYAGSAKFVRASNQVLKISANTAFTLGLNNFTLEWWQYQTSRAAYDSPWCYDNNAVTWQSKLMYMTVGPAGHNFAISNGVNTWAWIPSLGTLPTMNAWHHYAITREGTSWGVFIDGTRVANTNGVTVNIAAQTGTMNIGSSTANSAPFDGYITNFRYINGTAVYSPNVATISVPTSPLTAIANTKLLLSTITSGTGLLTDSSTNRFTVTNSSNAVTWNSVSPFFGNAYSSWYLYVNGSPVGNITSRDTLKVVSTPTIGGTQSGASMNGDIAGVQTYTRVLTPTEHLENANYWLTRYSGATPA